MSARLKICLAASVCLALSASAQTFDVEAYKSFLASNTSLSTGELLARHDLGLFERNIGGHFADARYSDSLVLKLDLTADEQSLIDRHGFVVTERLSPSSFGEAFMNIYKADMPVFISTDAILHALHMSYDRILMDVETEVLYGKLETLLEQFHADLPALRNEYAAQPAMLQSLKDLDVYLTVPIKLLTGRPIVPVWGDNQTIVDELMALIDAESPAAYPLFAENCRNVDFSQFTPRGHYTQEPHLTRYFQAMMWLGRTELYLIAPNTAECRASDQDVQRQVMMSFLLNELLDASGARTVLEDMDEVLGFFVGESDNITPEILRSLGDLVGISSAADIVDASTFRLFQDTLATKSFAFQRINSQILFSDDITDPDQINPASAFMLFGQRFVIDSYVTGHVVFDEVIPTPPIPPRMLPSTQDVLFALGNDASAQLLADELDRYGYAANLSALRYLVDSYEPAFWSSTIYNGWLDAIRTLNPPPVRAALPDFMRTAAWWQEKMNTQLASWAQLRHDNLLYAKQSYSGGVTCFYPHSYVEPIPAFYQAMSRLATTSADRFETLEPRLGNMAGHVADYFRYVGAVNDTLGVVAQKELDAEPLTEHEGSFLRRMLRLIEGCGADVPDGWYPRLYYGDSERAILPDLIVADVHTAPTDEFGNRIGWVLHAGTGMPNLAIITADIPGEGAVAFVGPVLSYIEHLSTGFARLTDEAWEAAHAAEPSARPAFVDLYLADPNGRARAASVVLPTSVDDPVSDDRKANTLLAAAYPNPFRGSTAVSFALSWADAHSTTDLTIYDVQGRVVRRLVSAQLPANHYTVRWNGRTDSGAAAASGVYFARLVVGNSASTVSVTLIR